MSQTGLLDADVMKRTSSASTSTHVAPQRQPSQTPPPAAVSVSTADDDDDDERIPKDAFQFAFEQLQLEEKADAERKAREKNKGSSWLSCDRGSAEVKPAANDNATLPGWLTAVDKLGRAQWVRLLDAVGAPDKEDYDPTQYPKSVWGAVFTTLLRLLILCLIVWYAIELFSFSTTVNQGAIMQWNAPLPGMSGQQLDVPTLEFSLSTTLTFYEQSSSSLQRVDVQDMTGYNPTLVSTTNKVPLATSFYDLSTLDLNSFDPNTQTVQPLDSSVVQVNMGDRTYAISTHAFKETMKVLYESAQVYPSVDAFYNHSVYLYVRIPQTALSNIKPCQLQIALYNKAVYDGLQQAYVLDDRRYQTSTTFPSLVTGDDLWIPSAYGKAAKSTLVQLLNSQDNLVVLESRMTWADVVAFATSSNWGPEPDTGVSAFYNLSKVTLNDTDGLMGQLDFLNWEVSLSYINNFMYTFTNISCDGDDTSFDLFYAESNMTVDATATTLIITAWEYGSDVWDDFDPAWLPFEILVVGAQGQEQMTVVAVTDGTNLTVVRGSPAVDFIWTGPDFVCDPNVFPQTVAELSTPWTCDAAKYWANDECDCSCGAYDPDCCLMIGADVANCADQQTCSPSGQCVNAFVSNSSLLLISETCYNINYPGQITLAGYVGSDSDFAGAGGNMCFPCPSDQTFYDGLPQLDGDSSLYTCNVAAVGMLNGEINFLTAVTTTTDVTWQLAVQNAPLPVQGYPYPITVGVGEGTAETLYVYAATPVVNDTQTVTVASASHTSKFKYQHVSIGKLVSALDVANNLPVVIKHPLDQSNPPTFSFGTSGPYNIRGGEQALVVADASIALNRPYQVLRLQAAPGTMMGYVSYLQQAAPVNATSIKVAAFNFWWDSQVGTADTYWLPVPYPSIVPMTLRGDQDYTGLEVIHDVTVSAPPTWLCDPAYFHAGDGCDCNCGLWDPDCSVTDPYYPLMVYDSSVNCTLTACDYNTSCAYCAWSNTTESFPTGNCSATDPNNPDPIPLTTDSQTFYQVLTFSVPLLLNHAAGSGVETPVPLTSGAGHVSSWYDDTSSYYDVFTYTEVQVDRTSQPFTPDDRYNSHPPELTTSPSSMQVELAMFIVPDRAPFNGTPLCAAIPTVNSVQPTFTEYGWNQWTVAAGRQMNVSQCHGAPVNASYVAANCVSVESQEALQDYNKHCIVEMPPSYTHSFVTTMPVNNKWLHSAANTVDGSNEPEFSFDFQVIYYFGRDDSFISAEDQFAANQGSGGDYDRQGNVFTFYGQLNEAQPGDGPTELGLPANTPYANVQLNLQPSAFALADLQALQPTNWPTDTVTLEALIASFPTLNFTWDLDIVGGSTALQQVPLLPGHAYFLTSEIEVVTKYWTDIIGRTHVDSWTLQATASSAAIVQLDYFLRQQAVIRYKLSIKDDSYQLVEVYVTTVSGFFGNVGGALAYLAYAVTAVYIFHRLTRWDARQDLYKKAQEKLKKQKEADKKKTAAPVPVGSSTEMTALKGQPTVGVSGGQGSVGKLFHPTAAGAK